MEQELFQKTLTKGLVEINSILSVKNNLTSKDAFYLFETYGFPFELTNEIAVENNIHIDEEEFKQYFEEHKTKSNKSRSIKAQIEFDTDPNTFIGYEKLEVNAEIQDIHTTGDKQILFFNETPFYYDAGGQVSDEGILIKDEIEYKITDLIQTSSGATGLVTLDTNFNIGDTVTQLVDTSFRNAVSKSHTAAHMVHASLRNILGSHVAQAGSHVAPGKFRFDFSHTSKVKQEEIDLIFNETNSQVFNDLIIRTDVMNIDKAKDEGALAFFGDKYDDDVRVVSIGNFSKELCGGTHVDKSNDVGLIVLTSESSIGSNLRRVEMLSGVEAYNFLSVAYKSYQDVSKILKTSVDEVPKKLNSFLENYEELTSKLSQLKSMEINTLAKKIAENPEIVKNNKLYIGEVSLDSNNDLKDLALEAISTESVDIVILLSKIGVKTGIVGAVSKKIDLDISKVVGDASQLYGG